jgi:hypothetical protein
MQRRCRRPVVSLTVLFHAAALATACGPANEQGVSLPKVFTIRGIATNGAELNDVAANDLAPYILYKSATCPTPGAASCLDPRAVGNTMPDAETGQLSPLSGASLPSDEFVRANEPASANVKFTNAAHPDATWSYGLLLVAPKDNVNIDGASIDAMPDSTPFSLGAMVIQADGVSDDELAARGLNDNDDNGRSVSVVSLTTGDTFARIDTNTVIDFPVRTLGTVRDEIVFPALFDDEELKPLE